MTAASTPPADDSLALLAHGFADRLRTLPESRWRRPVGSQELAAAALGVAQRLADLAAGIAARDGVAPARRAVPDLGPFAVPDQIAVTATDLADALAGVEADDPVWTADGGREPLGVALQRAREELRALAETV